ncbi:MAG TPA: HAMP domain-containing sensor histidine kinase [Candidatus Limnocylindrales bacterium]
MSLRWRIALGFALVALATAAIIALAAPPIVSQGFSDYDTDGDGGGALVTTPGPTFGIATGTDVDNESDDSPAPTTTSTAQPTAPGPNPSARPDDSDAPAPPPPGPTNNDQAQQTTIFRLILAALIAASLASLVGLIGASRLVRPLTRLEQAAVAVARGDLGRRSGLADRSDEFGQLGRTFDSMAAQLQTADETRRGFLQDAAHELKTPLAVIDATSSAILDGVYTPERRHLETIRDQSRILARIVDDLRTISLAEGGHLPLERRPLNVRAVLDSVAAGFEARAASGSVKLSVDAAAGIVVEADADRLRQVIGALVDNALRHTPAGGSVHISAAASAAQGPIIAGKAAPSRSVVRLAVEDTGAGIPAESLPHIFERFYQADPSRSRGTGTSGLGLSIVRALAEAHGWRVGAENCPNGGARLWLELPALRLA